MSRLRAIDASDVAVVAGVALLWVGLGMVNPALPFIVIGSLCLAFGAVPIILTLTRRRR